MNARRTALQAIALSVLLAGCATTDSELTQKEKDKIARDLGRGNQKQTKAQEKMTREATQGTPRKGAR